MRYEVLLTAGAEHDLESIVDYIAANEGEAAAEHVLDRLLETAEQISRPSERGSYPKELIALGIRDRQLFFGPFRLICRLMGSQVFIVLIADGRRDMQALLARRLLGGSGRP
jgi:toxin ParE1/3/4